MSERIFITRPLSQLLDVVRVMAALVVLTGHGVSFGLYNGPEALGWVAPHAAVMVFFVLSGVVIAHSVKSRPTGASDYAAARIARILPLTVVAVVFSLATALYGAMVGIEYAEPGPTPTNVALPLFFLSESAVGSGLVWNPPFWSLAYEAMYYALFGVVAFASGWMRWLLLALLSVVAGIKVLLLLPVWLLGVALERFGGRLSVGVWRGICLSAFGIALALLAISKAEVGTQMLTSWLGWTQDQLGYSELALTDTFVGVGVVLCFIGLRPVANLLQTPLEKLRGPIRAAADLSFPLYILHWPMMVLLAAFGVQAGSNIFAYIGILLLLIGLTAAIAAPVQKRTAGLRPMLARLFARNTTGALQPA